MMHDGWDRDVSKSAHLSSIRLFGSSGYGTYGRLILQTDRGLELDWVGGPWAGGGDVSRAAVPRRSSAATPIRHSLTED